MENLEIFEVEKEETELTIQQLENLDSNLRELIDLTPIGLAKEKLSAYIKDIERELNWKEEELEQYEKDISIIQERE
jgi:hypothetical protein